MQLPRKRIEQGTLIAAVRQLPGAQRAVPTARLMPEAAHHPYTKERS